MDISVIICTHNPRPDYLCRVLASLKAQTLPLEQWELLLVDNASGEPLAKAWDLSWHPNAHHIREDELGLTPARLRGIKESTGDFLVFVDDDNVMAADYLAEMPAIFRQWPTMGAIGGSIRGEFETDPPDWIRPYISSLAVFELGRNYWSNFEEWSLATPLGAGLSVRRQVALAYTEKVRGSSLRRMLDRCGQGMGAGGDTDLALCAVDLGLGTGRFTTLKMTHLIPSSRLTRDYIVRLYAGFAVADEVLRVIRKNPPAKIDLSFPLRKKLRWLNRFLRMRGLKRDLFLACEKSRWQARRMIAANLSASAKIQAEPGS